MGPLDGPPSVQSIRAPMSAPSLGQGVETVEPMREGDSPTSHLLRRRRRLGTASLNVVAPAKGPVESCSFRRWLADRFDIQGTIGQGTTSLVRHATRLSDSHDVALKIMMSTDPEMVDFMHQEFEVLQRHQHPHIIRALDFLCYRGKTAVLVLEYFDGVPLNELVKCGASRHLSEGSANRLTKALMQAVEHLHQHRVLHRDIKPQNVLVSRDASQIRLIDFNTACSLNVSDSLTPTGTRLYAAPEVIQGQSPSASADVWGVGLCAYLMLSGRLPQKRDRCTSGGDRPLHQVVQDPVAFSSSRWQCISEPCIDMLKRCLAVDPQQRPTPKVLLESSWFHPGSLSALIGSAFTKCPLLPGLEPAMPDDSLSCYCRSVGTASTGVPSPASCLESPRVQCRQWVHEDCRLPGGLLVAEALLEPGARVEIVGPRPTAAGPAEPDAGLDVLRPFELWHRIGQKATVLTADVTSKAYKVRFSDHSVKFISVDHARACV